jgi:hypothetical protein
MNRYITHAKDPPKSSAGAFFIKNIGIIKKDP